MAEYTESIEKRIVDAMKASDAAGAVALLRVHSDALASEGLGRLLCRAAWEELELVVEELIRLSAPIDHVAEIGHMRLTPLQYSLTRDCLAVTQRLLDGGASVAVVDGEGSSVLQLSIDAECETRDGLEIPVAVASTQLLLEHGADVNVVADDGSTALDLASVRDHKPAVELLRKKGARRGSLRR